MSYDNYESRYHEPDLDENNEAAYSAIEQMNAQIEELEQEKQRLAQELEDAFETGKNCLERAQQNLSALDEFFQDVSQSKSGLQSYISDFQRARIEQAGIREGLQHMEDEKNFLKTHIGSLNNKVLSQSDRLYEMVSRVKNLLENSIGANEQLSDIAAYDPVKIEMQRNRELVFGLIEGNDLDVITDSNGNKMYKEYVKDSFPFGINNDHIIYRDENYNEIYREHTNLDENPPPPEGEKRLKKSDDWFT